MVHMLYSSRSTTGTKISSFVGVVCLALFVASCASSALEDETIILNEKKYVKPTRELDGLALTKSQEEYFSAVSNEAFSALSKRILVNPNNHLLSPIGFHLLSAMCAPLVNDAQYYAVLNNTFDLPGMDDSSIHSLSKAFINKLPALDNSVDFITVNMAVIFHDSNDVAYHFPAGYDKLIDDYYDGVVVETKKTDAFSSKLTNWVQNYSAGRLSLLPLFSSVNLVSNSYFSGCWKFGFDPNNTRVESFKTVQGKYEEHPMMCMSGTYKVYQHDKYTSIKLPLGEKDRLSMTIVLPSEDESIIDVLNTLSETGLNGSFEEKDATLFLPKIKITDNAYIDDFSPELANSISKSDFFHQFIFEGASDYSILQSLGIEWNEAGIMASSSSFTGQLDYSSEDENKKENALVVKINRPFIFSIGIEGTSICLYCGFYGGSELL